MGKTAVGRIHSKYQYIINSLPPVKFFMLFCRLLIFSKSSFSKNSFRNTIRVSNSLVPDQTDVLSGLIWVQTVCICYQQMTQVGKELR